MTDIEKPTDDERYTAKILTELPSDRDRVIE